MTADNRTGRLTVTPSNISTASLLYLDEQYVAKVEAEADTARRIAASYNATLSVPLDVLERIDVGKILAEGIDDYWRTTDEGRAALGETDR